MDNERYEQRFQAAMLGVLEHDYIHDLQPWELRRITACRRGWTKVVGRSAALFGNPPGTKGDAERRALPNPAKDANQALALLDGTDLPAIEFARDTDGRWHATQLLTDYDFSPGHEGGGVITLLHSEPSLAMAITKSVVLLECCQQRAPQL